MDDLATHFPRHVGHDTRIVSYPCGCQSCSCRDCDVVDGRISADCPSVNGKPLGYVHPALTAMNAR